MSSNASPPISPVLRIEDLHKTFRLGLLRKRVDAVRGIGFEVQRGEIFGFLGPNGAGKTTTIKMVLRLIYPDRGRIELFGKPAGDRALRQRLGYLPENPYIYQYLRPMEFLDLCGHLVGLDKRARRRRAHELLAKVGLAHAADRPIGRFSKGMMQRIGLAQALLHDPELLILDEPFSGLDPIGRKDVRDVLLEQRHAGKTLVFTSHILSDVERLCDRVAIVQRGRIAAQGRLDALLDAGVRRTEIELAHVTSELHDSLRALVAETTMLEDKLQIVVEGDEAVHQVLQRAMQAGAHVVSVVPQRETLEDLFVRNAVADAA